MGKNYLITGATGFVGRYIMKRLLEQSPFNYIYLLIRKDKHNSAEDRLHRMLPELFTPIEISEYKQRIRTIEADITKDNLGLPNDVYQSLVSRIHYIFHSAATIKFNLDLDDASDINIKGTRMIMNLAQKCMIHGTLEHVYHISTAYVTGRISASSDDAPVFANTYEKTKYESELLIGQYIQSGMPVTIFRPSIISGNGKTGEITTSNIIFRFLAMLSRESLAALPGPTSLNLIPLNNFIDILFEIIANKDSLGKTYNITNPRNVPFVPMIGYACKLLNVITPKFIPLQQKDKLPDKTIHQIGVFMPYFEEQHHFDLSNTYHILGRDSIYCDDVILSIKPIVEYCLTQKLLRKGSSSPSSSLSQPTTLPSSI